MQFIQTPKPCSRTLRLKTLKCIFFFQRGEEDEEEEEREEEDEEEEGEEEEEVDGVQVDGFQEFQTDVTGNRGKNNSKHFLLSDNIQFNLKKVAFVDEDVFVRDD